MTPLFQLVFILVVGTFCQIIGWRTKIPSILLLLIAGILSGPVFSVLAPDALFGPVLMPFVELAVAVILFEGGLSLKRTELGKVGSIVIRLITFSTVVTWILLSVLSYVVLKLTGPASTLLGAILVISGPTVVIPLLRLIRARAPVEQILKWEGILIDPIGVILAVLVAEVCEVGFDLSSPVHVVKGILVALSIGGCFGWVGAQILKHTIGKHSVPDQLIVPLTLAVLFLFVIISNMLHEQSGLLTSTVMGLAVARNHKAWVRTIEDFIGHTQRMFIAVLFIILAARLDPKYLQHFDAHLCIFILITVIFVRPFAVLISTIGVKLSFRERLAIAALAPRGIVSAALASTLGAPLVDSGVAGMEAVVPYTFATIIGTVAIYGIFSPYIFKACKVQQVANEGVLFVGGGQIAIAIAKLLKEEGFRVLLVDTNQFNIKRIEDAGLESYQGDILSDSIQEDVDFEGLGKLLALTSNDEANSLATVEFRHIFGGKNVFQLSSPLAGNSKVAGRIFVNQDFTLERMEVLWSQGYRPIVRQTHETRDSIEKADEYVLAEIEVQRLFIISQDNLGRATKPEKKIIFRQYVGGEAVKNV